jgi:hypothetical protein
MTNETEQSTNVQATETETSTEGKTKDWEKIAKDAQRRADKFKTEFESLKQSQLDVEAAAEKKKLEAAGQYDVLLKKTQSEYETKLADFQRQILKRDVKDTIRSAGATDDVFLEWAIDRYAGPAEEIVNYIATLKEDVKTAHYFLPKEDTQSIPIGNRPPAPASVRGSKPQSLEDRLKSTDPEVKRAALKEQFAQAVR